MNQSLLKRFLTHTCLGITTILIVTTEPQAGCNSDRSRACGNTYFGKVEAHKAEIPALRSRQNVLPSLIQVQLDERLRLNAAIEGINHEIPLKEQIIANAKRNNVAFSQISAAAKASVTSFRGLGKTVQEQVPSLIARLNQFLFVRETLIAERLTEIAVLLETETDKGMIEALLYEKQRMTDVQTFAGAYASVKEAQEALTAAFKGEDINLNVNLPPETAAMFREAAQLVGQYRDSDEAVLKVEMQLNEIANVAEKSIQVNDANVVQQTAEIVKLKARIAQLTAAKAGVDGTWSALTAELNGLPARIALSEAGLVNSNHYWNCCDNTPHCEKLPNYAAFEVSASRPGTKCN